MALIEIVRDVPMPADAAWRRVTDWARHGDAIPFTTVEERVRGFTARTGWGRLGFDDPMDIVEWWPPTSCRIEKRGRVVRGWAEIEVTPRGSASTVRWTEEISLRGLPRALDPVVAAAGRRMFARVLTHLLTDPES